MKAFVVLALAACSQAALIASPYSGFAGLPYGIHGAPYGFPYNYNYAPYSPVAPVAPASTQFNSADEFGNTNYGYSNINSAKHEVGNAYGGVTGSYSYVDPNGLLQTVNYIADHFGFRVAATNLPVAKSAELEQPVFNLVGPTPVEDTEEVKAARAEFEKVFAEAQAASRKRRSSEEVATLPASTVPLTIPAPAFAYSAAPAFPYAAATGYPYAAPAAYPYGAAAYPYITGAAYPYAAAGYPYAYAGYPYATPALSYATSPILAA